MKTMKNILILLSFLLAFASCEKSEVEQPQQNPVDEVVDPCTEHVADVLYDIEIYFNGMNYVTYYVYRLTIQSQITNIIYGIDVLPEQYLEMLEDHEDEYCFP